MRVNMFNRFHKIGLVMVLMSVLGIVGFGQQPKQIAQAQQANEAKLRQYTWKSRTEIRKNEEVKSTRLNQVRYDFDGTLQETQLSATQPDIPTGGLRGAIAKKKKEDFMELLNDLGELAKSYGNLSFDKMRSFITNAVFTPERNALQSLISFQSKDVLITGDSMIIWVDATTKKQRKVEIQTYYDTHRVRIVTEFQDLPNVGITYMARSIIDYPTKELTITTENFDYVRKQ